MKRSINRWARALVMVLMMPLTIPPITPLVMGVSVMMGVLGGMYFLSGNPASARESPSNRESAPARESPSNRGSTSELERCPAALTQAFAEGANDKGDGKGNGDGLGPMLPLPPPLPDKRIWSGLDGGPDIAPDGAVSPARWVQSLGTKRGVVINFWATWCAPCLLEIPSLIRFAEKNDLLLIAVHIGKPDGLSALIRRHGWQSLRMVSISLAHARRYFGVRSIPATLLYRGDAPPLARPLARHDHPCRWDG